MIYIDPSMLAEHTGYHPDAVRRALRRHDAAPKAKAICEKTPGVSGIRITLTNANNFIRKQWPRVYAAKGPIVLEKEGVAA